LVLLLLLLFLFHILLFFVMSLFIFKLILHLPNSTLFPYTTLFRSQHDADRRPDGQQLLLGQPVQRPGEGRRQGNENAEGVVGELGEELLQPLIEEQHEAQQRSEEHTSELQSRENLVCRLLLEKKKNNSR